MKIQLYHGDCLEKMQDIPNASVDMVMADLPYGTTACKWDSVIPFEPLWAEYHRVCKRNAAIVLTASQPFTSTLVVSNIKNFKYCLVWDKVNRYTGYQLCNIQPLKRHEDICIFGHQKITYNKQFLKGKPYIAKHTHAVSETNHHNSKKRLTTVNNGDYNPYSIIQIKSNNRKEIGLHPTQKPVALMEYLIRTYSNEGETVLDNTMGSGTTGVACVNTNRNFIGIEMDESYFEIAAKRIQQAKENFGLFIGNDKN